MQHIFNTEWPTDTDFVFSPNMLDTAQCIKPTDLSRIIKHSCLHKDHLQPENLDRILSKFTEFSEGPPGNELTMGFVILQLTYEKFYKVVITYQILLVFDAIGIYLFELC